MSLLEVPERFPGAHEAMASDGSKVVETGGFQPTWDFFVH